jgi:light-regulated signal transduction histidine kinase (bacteriophytochrome)
MPQPTDPFDPKDHMDPTIAALQAELAALRGEMQNFTATVSHDLRAPLRRIVSYAQLVQQDAGPQLSAEVQDFLGTLADSAKQLGEMLDALLELSRLGTAPLHTGPVPLEAIVREVVAAVHVLYPQRVVQWHIASPMPTVLADTSLLRKTLHHVLDNAAKFTAPKAMAEISVTAEASPGLQQVRLRIQDNGVGFNPALAQQLFQPFQRLHSAKQFAGMGMGLALAHKMLMRMNAGIAIEGVADTGCCVTLELRRA